MVMAEQSQVGVGSEDSVSYIINVHSMSCNKQLTDHRSSVTGLAVQDGVQATRCAGLHWGGAACLVGGSGSQGAGSRWPGRRSEAGLGGEPGDVPAWLWSCVRRCGLRTWSEKTPSGVSMVGTRQAPGLPARSLALGLACRPWPVDASLKSLSSHGTPCASVQLCTYQDAGQYWIRVHPVSVT